MRLAIGFVLDAATSLRSAAGCLNLVLHLEHGQQHAGPSHTTVQNLLLRLGLYELTRTKERADDWIWITDHTIKGGVTKCLVILGIRYDQYQHLTGPLQHRDMQTLALIPVDKSTGEIVQGQLDELAGLIGVPMGIVSDHGSDLKKGIRLFQEEHPEVVSLYDIIHLLSRLIDAILSKDAQWATFRQECCRCGNAIRQSPLSHLCPLAPKKKARHMNIGGEIQWGARSLQLVQKSRDGKLTDDQLRQLTPTLIEKKLGWLENYREALSRWEELWLMSEQVCAVVRAEGYHATLTTSLKSQLPGPVTESAALLTAQVLEFSDRVQAEVGEGRHLPGSSEVIESLIGKGKRLDGVNNTRGFTAQLLAMAASVATPTAEVIMTALKTCGIKHVQQWCSKHLAPSSQSLRKRDLKPTDAEQNRDKLISHAIPDF